MSPNDLDELCPRNIAEFLGCGTPLLEEVAKRLRNAHFVRVENKLIGQFWEHVDEVTMLGDKPTALAYLLGYHRARPPEWREVASSTVTEPRQRDHILAAAAKYFELLAVGSGLQRGRLWDRLSIFLQELLKEPGFRWPDPAPPHAVSHDECRYMVATFLIEAAIEEEEGWGDEAPARVVTVDRKLRLIYPHMSRYPDLENAHDQISMRQWEALYTQLRQPWGVLVWMLGYSVREWDLDSSTDRSARNRERTTDWQAQQR